MSIKKIIFIALGFIFLALGCVGIFLPILPTVPFLLLSAFFFSKSSEKLHNWFKSTKIYKNNLESYVKGQGMTKKTKLKIILTVTIVMGIGFIMMHRLLIPRIILAIVWVAHMIYFIFFVKNKED